MAEMTPFIDAKPGDESYVYRRADNEPIYGEYGWVTDLDYFEDEDDDIRLKRQRWQLISEDVIEIIHRTALCPTCHGDETVPSPAGIDVKCETCGGDGGHPQAGETRIIEGEPS